MGIIQLVLKFKRIKDRKSNYIVQENVTLHMVLATHDKLTYYEHQYSPIQVKLNNWLVNSQSFTLLFERFT